MTTTGLPLVIVVTWFGVLIGTLVVGNGLSGKPVSQLGQRPRGTGLLSWFWNSISTGVGIYGYDSSLGCWSPAVRVMIHLCIMGMISGFAMALLNGEDDLVVIISGVCAFYLGSLYWIHNVLPNVSHPGGPRQHKIQRIPKFPDSVSTAPSDGWRCAVAQDSHEVTTSLIPQGKMTGEPFGRQIWTTSAAASKSTSPPEKQGGFFGFGGTQKTVDEKLVQQLAAGGRSEGFNPSQNPNSCDKIFRAQQIRNHLLQGKEAPDLKSKPKTAKEAARKAIQFYGMLQTEDGHWAGDYGGPHFLMPGLIVVWYVMGKPDKLLNEEQIKLMIHYITVHQQTDGGWGTHIESPSTMFGSVLMYVSLRLLGVAKDDDRCVRGRAFIQEYGGAVMTSSWAKFYLCLLGCMEWDGHNSVPAEMWLLPNWCPFHPGRMWCHARMVYLPMGYLYGSRFIYDKVDTDPLISSLREEIYCQPYESIDWINTRHLVADLDNYSQIPLIMEFLQNVLARYETWSIFQPFKNYVRKFGLEFSINYMRAEDLQTNFIDIGPVNKVLNMLSAYHDAGNDINEQRVINHMMRVPDYLWVAEDGMKMQGYNGSQCWDTSFAIQGVWEAGLLDEFPEMSKKVWSFLERTQILSTKTSQSSPAYEYESAANRDQFYRHVSEGGWPFSTSAHGWPISDCTGEGLKGVLCLRFHSKTIQDGLKSGELLPIDETRLQKAVNVCLTLQNEDGGWATYENNRGFGWYEQLNPSEVFGDIMIDYSYVECSMATLTALADFSEHFPNHRVDDIAHAIVKGREFLKSIQRPDGSWYGSWACCFCYGCWFGIEGLIKAGEPTTSPAIKKACEFLLAHQRENGGWGEDFTSCYDKDYAKNGMDAYGDDGSGVVNTGWALLALSAAKCPNMEAVKRGVKYLMERQLPSGDWPQEGIAGVFNRACGITYTAYRNVFPIWALGRCTAVYGDDLEKETERPLVV